MGQFIVWGDLETTGLDPRHDRILAAGFLITDHMLNPIAEFEEIASCSEYDLARMPTVVLDMHTRSGLLDKVRNSRLRLADVEANAVDFLRAHMGDQLGFLAGSSIHFDREFLRAQMPGVYACLNYRQIDVSTLKVLAGMWLPDIAAPKLQRKPDHTPLADVRATLSEFAYWRAHMFKPGIGP